MATVGVMTFVCIRQRNTTEKMLKIQKMIVFAFTIIESAVILSLCIYTVAISTRAPAVIGVLFEAFIPGLVVVAVKLWLIFIRKHVE